MESFDERAATWDEPAKVARAEEIAAAIEARVPVDHSTRLFEYGAGTGLVSQALSSAVGSITMADTSSGMREQMQRKVAEGTIPNARVWDLDLSAGGSIPDDRFDLVITSMVLHHVDPLDRTLAAFHDLLVPGGHLCIADLDHEDGSFHGEGFAGHPGFRRDELAEELRGAGFDHIAFEDCGQVDRNDRLYTVFLATAAR